VFPHRRCDHIRARFAPRASLDDRIVRMKSMEDECERNVVRDVLMKALGINALRHDDADITPAADTLLVER